MVRGAFVTAMSGQPEGTVEIAVAVAIPIGNA
jgi:hypothetical protein